MIKKLFVLVLLTFSALSLDAQIIKTSFGIKGAGVATVVSTPKDATYSGSIGGGGGAFFGNVGSFEEGYEFDAVVMDDTVLQHPQSLSLAERMERAVYLGLDEKNIVAKFVAGKRLF